MKVAINVILALCVAGLLYICVGSVMGPINFKKEKEKREAAVIKRLIEIRKAEEWYKKMHQEEFCDTFSVLIDFVKNQKVYIVNKEGQLSDEQLDSGLTEEVAAAIVNRGDLKEIAAKGLAGFRRDTIWFALGDSIFGEGFVADSLEYIPYGGGQKFDLEKFYFYSTRSESSIWIMECRASYDQYLQGLSKREITNLKLLAEKGSRYPGLKIGDLSSPNNNAGNWEE